MRISRPRLSPWLRVSTLDRSGNHEWVDAWKAADRAAGTAIETALAREEDPFEGRAVAEVAALLPDGATLVVGNSMPIRDVDAFVRGDRRKLRIVSNRGANGIDGVISAALGAAAVADGPVVLVVGDLSFFHDLNGMLAATKFDIWTPLLSYSTTMAEVSSRSCPKPSSSMRQPLKFCSARRPVSTSPPLPGSFGVKHARPQDWVAFRRELCRAIQGDGLSDRRAGHGS